MTIAQLRERVITRIKATTCEDVLKLAMQMMEGATKRGTLQGISSAKRQPISSERTKTLRSKKR